MRMKNKPKRLGINWHDANWKWYLRAETDWWMALLHFYTPWFGVYIAYEAPCFTRHALETGYSIHAGSSSVHQAGEAAAVLEQWMIRYPLWREVANGVPW